MKKSFWRSTLKVFSKSEKYTDDFKNYKVPSSKSELPNRADFSGDKQPSSGDPAKIELNHWHSGNSAYQKDKKVEKSNEKIPSPVTQETNKREFVGKDAVEKTSNKRHWRKVFADVSFQQKSDGEVSIDVTGIATPDDSLSEETLENEEIPPTENFSNWRKRLTASDADMDFKREPDGTMVLKVKHLNNADNLESPNTLEETPLAQSLQAPEVEAPSSSQESFTEIPQNNVMASANCTSAHKDMKEHILKKEGNLALIARECADKVGIFIEASSNNKLPQVLAQEVHARNGKFWRELINESLWINHFDNYMSINK